MISKLIKGAVVAVAFAAAPMAMTTPALAQDVDYAAQVAELGGDVKKGKKVFRKCKSCHMADKPKNRVGAHLVGIIGRPAAAVEDFSYSDAMAAKGAEGMVWDVATLQGYLADPKGFIPDNKMAFAGLKKDADIANVIAYLLDEGGVYEPTQ